MVDDELTKKYKSMFVAGAIFNWQAATLAFFPNFTFGLLGVAPIPKHDLTLHLVCILVAAYGFAYYYASIDFPGNANSVYIGMVAKATVVVAAIIDILLGITSWQILLIIGWDAVFAYLFYGALEDLKKSKGKTK